MSKLLHCLFAMAVATMCISCGGGDEAENLELADGGNSASNGSDAEANAVRPFAITKQIGLGNFYLMSFVSLSGESYTNASVTFLNIAGGLDGRATPIYLNPQNFEYENLTLKGGHMTLTVNSIDIVFPTPEQIGHVYLSATFTDIFGRNSQTFEGRIAAWSLWGPETF